MTTNLSDRVHAHAADIVDRPATFTLQTIPELHRWCAATELLEATSNGERRTDLVLAFTRADTRCAVPVLAPTGV